MIVALANGAHHMIVALANRVPVPTVGSVEELRNVMMKTAELYRQYAADCLRIAETMNAKDKQVLTNMAEAWKLRAQEAEREEKKNR
jgi:hypothetical protein